MLPGMVPVIAASAAGNVSLLSALTTLGLTTGLKLALDAGDIASWPGSGEKWLDTAGGGYDFWRGTGTGSDSADPTFNGTAGALTSGEYWSFDGGDYFTYDTTNETWMQNIHKDNAKVAWAGWVYLAGGLQTIFGNLNNNLAGGTGIAFYPRADGTVRCRVRNGSGNALEITTTGTHPTGAWCFLSGRIDEAVGAGGAALGINATFETFTSTYSSPSSGNASINLTIGSCGTNEPIENGGRMAEFAMWEGTIPSQSDLTAIFNATKGRFGL